MMKGAIFQEAIVILNVYALSNRAANVKQFYTNFILPNIDDYKFKIQLLIVF